MRIRRLSLLPTLLVIVLAALSMPAFAQPSGSPPSASAGVSAPVPPPPPPAGPFVEPLPVPSLPPAESELTAGERAEQAREAAARAAEEAEKAAREAERLAEEAERRAEEAEEALPGHNGRSGKGDLVVKEKNIVVGPQEEISTDIVNFGGDTTIHGKVMGDVVSFGGTIVVSGEVFGNVVAFGGPLELEEGAHIHGDAIGVGEGVEKHDGADIDGQIINVSGALGSVASKLVQKFAHSENFHIDVDDDDEDDSRHRFRGDHSEGCSTGTKFGFLLGWLILGVIIMALAPAHVKATASELVADPLRASLMGFAGLLAMLVVSVVLCITIIGIPLSIMLWLFMLVSYIFGGVSLFYAAGERVSAAAGRTLAPILAFGVGWVLLGLLIFIPFCIGPILWFVVSLPAFGAVLSTRFGSNRPWLKRPANSVPPPPSAGNSEAPVGSSTETSAPVPEEPSE